MPKDVPKEHALKVNYFQSVLRVVQRSINIKNTLHKFSLQRTGKSNYVLPSQVVFFIFPNSSQSFFYSGLQFFDEQSLMEKNGKSIN